MRTRLWITVLIFLIPGLAVAAKIKPQLCVGGRFVVSDGPVFPDDTSSGSDTLLLRDGMVSIGAACPPTPLKWRVSKKGSIGSAKWAACGGYLKVTFRGSIDPNCGSLIGRVTAKKGFKRLVSAKPRMAGTLYGKLLVDTVLKVPKSSRKELSGFATELDELGVEILGGGEELLLDSEPGDGWRILFDGQWFKTAEGGDFSLPITTTSATRGQLFHPLRPAEPAAWFGVAQLSAVSADDGIIRVKIRVQPGCGMDGGETSKNGNASCHEGGVENPDQSIQQRDQASRVCSNSSPPFVHEQRGTYPQHQECCLDYDGPLNGYTPPVNCRGTRFHPFCYLASTCEKRVKSKCCQFERADLGLVFGSLFFPTYIPGPISCVDNHFGRYCQAVVPGDVSVEVNGAVFHGGSEAIVDVAPGEQVGLVVHNNACRGETLVYRSGSVDGQLEGTNATFGERPAIIHTGAGGYLPDRSLTYRAPTSCGQIGASQDVVTFEADGRSIRVVFQCGAGFDLVDISAPTRIACNSQGPISASWSGDPTFPVSALFRIVGCSAGVTCSASTLNFSANANPLRWVGTCTCQGPGPHSFSGRFAVRLRDQAGLETREVQVGWTCTDSLNASEAPGATDLKGDGWVEGGPTISNAPPAP